MKILTGTMEAPIRLFAQRRKPLFRVAPNSVDGEWLDKDIPLK